MTAAEHIDGLVLDSRNSSVLVMELLQSCTKPSICQILNSEKMLQISPSPVSYI